MLADLIARLEALDKAATPGPWREAAPQEYPWRIGPNDYRGEPTFTVISDSPTERGYGVVSVPMSLTDYHAGNRAVIATLRNELPRLLRLLRAGRGRMLEALERCDEYMDQRADADLAPGGEAMQPNREMVLMQEIRAALREWDEAARG